MSGVSVWVRSMRVSEGRGMRLVEIHKRLDVRFLFGIVVVIVVTVPHYAKPYEEAEESTRFHCSFY